MRHGLRNRQVRDRLCQHADHPGHLQRDRWRVSKGAASSPTATGTSWGQPQRSADALTDGPAVSKSSRPPQRLLEHTHHPDQLQWDKRRTAPTGGLHRRHERQSLRHNPPTAGHPASARYLSLPAAVSRRIQASPMKTWALSTPVGRSREPEISMAVGADGILWRNTQRGCPAMVISGPGGGFTGEDLGVLTSGWHIVGTGEFQRRFRSEHSLAELVEWRCPAMGPQWLGVLHGDQILGPPPWFSD